MFPPVDEIGKHVRFSPTGRFVFALAENYFVIRDGIDGKVARQHINQGELGFELAWDDHDSFLIGHDYAPEGGESDYILTSLEEGGETDIACCGQGSFLTLDFKLDLENNIAVSVDDSSKFISSLTIQPLHDPVRSDETNWAAKNEEAMKLRDALIDARVVVFAEPKSWETIDGLKIIYSTELESKNW
jgi:hypothetical protein